MSVEYHHSYEHDCDEYCEEELIYYEVRALIQVDHRRTEDEILRIGDLFEGAVAELQGVNEVECFDMIQAREEHIPQTDDAKGIIRLPKHNWD